MSISGLNSLEKRTAVSLASVFTMRMLGLFMLMPVIAIYGQELEGYSPLWIGLAIGAYGLTQALLQIPMGMLSDRFGRHRVIIAGLLMFAAGSVIAALSDSVYGVTVGRIIQGMGAIASATLALAADLTRDEQRPKVMAVIGMSIGISFAIAMVLGPLLADAFGLAGLFWLTAVFALSGIAIVTLFVPTAVNRAPKGETVAIPHLLSSLIKHPQLLRLDLGVMLLHLMLTCIFVVLPTMLVSFDFTVTSHWKMYFPVLLGSFLLMVPMIIFAAKRNKEKQVFKLAIMMIIVSLLGLYFAHQSLTVVVLWVLLFFVGFNYLEASLPALISRLAPAGQKGSAMGIFSSSQFFGAFLGGLLGGMIAQTNQLEIVFAVAAVIGLLWLFITNGMQIPQRSKLVSIATQLNDNPTAEVLASRLTELAGVIEATVVVEENRTYLKVIDKEFDIEAARSLVASVS
ncbi:MFS transporter [Flocculibacter collagenilyticus]|uniref:MFS transporter n=1 Tax=Flocculibacter collagenilyticus TaxID=2744479 RepID=UPI0018F6A344|nr:MFS transporter [Flocculibacter collagenilyticus]